MDRLTSIDYDEARRIATRIVGHTVEVRHFQRGPYTVIDVVDGHQLVLAEGSTWERALDRLEADVVAGRVRQRPRAADEERPATPEVAKRKRRLKAGAAVVRDAQERVRADAPVMDEKALSYPAPVMPPAPVLRGTQRSLLDEW